MRTLRVRLTPLGLTAVLIVACTGENVALTPDAATAEGGTAATGGTAANGGTAATGGTPATGGGAQPVAGAPGAGGQPGGAGEPGAGGRPVGPGDSDDDGVPDGSDNCPTDANHDQSDTDADGVGDVCDLPGPLGDADDDGVPDATDNCPRTANAPQTDTDGDGQGDACDDTSPDCTEEICNGRDDDCDRQVDEGLDCCAPACAGKVCGPDGCGGTCGTCPGDDLCAADASACLPVGRSLCEPCTVGAQCTGNGGTGACAQNNQTGETFCVIPCLLFCDFAGFDCLDLDGSGDTWCTPPLSTCTDPCLFVECGAGTHCDAGRCVADAAQDRCAGVRCPGEGETCDPETGFCVSG